MRVISFVPSWTETLIHWGVTVVGRTRYCIHPQEVVKEIPVIGGTKDTRWEKIKNLNADLIIVDKEENKKSILEKTPLPLHITHVESIFHMPEELRKIHSTFSKFARTEKILARVEKDILRWEKVLQQPAKSSLEKGILQWIKKPETHPDQIVYVIWKNPWMMVSKNTFIGSVLAHLGYEKNLVDREEKYPTFDIEKINTDKTLFLFSSEPYDFRQSDEVEFIRSLGMNAAIVDGECFSWFGQRSLKFLENK